MMVVFFQRFLDRNGNYEKRRTLDISQQTKTQIFVIWIFWVTLKISFNRVVPAPNSVKLVNSLTDLTRSLDRFQKSKMFDLCRSLIKRLENGTKRDETLENSVKTSRPKGGEKKSESMT